MHTYCDFDLRKKEPQFDKKNCFFRYFLNIFCQIQPYFPKETRVLQKNYLVNQSISLNLHPSLFQFFSKSKREGVFRDIQWWKNNIQISITKLRIIAMHFTSSSDKSFFWIILECNIFYHFWINIEKKNVFFRRDIPR